MGHGFCDKQTNLLFRLVSAPWFLPEVQRCRLLQYYCEFDSRIKPLLGVIHLWALVNKIRLGNANIDYQQTHCHVPDPGALEWLVVMFLLDKKIIPTPREVQEQPHQRLDFFSRNFKNEQINHDIGFSSDPQFAADWAEKNSPGLKDNVDAAVISILKLAVHFFTYLFDICARCNVKHRCILLNTRDGEILRKGQVFAEQAKTKLTPDEISDLREELKKDIYRRSRLLLMHPFYIKWRFSINDQHFLSQVLPVVKTTKAKLRHFLKRYRLSLDKASVMQSINLNEILMCTKRGQKIRLEAIKF